MIAFITSFIGITLSLLYPENAAQVSGPIFLLSIFFLGMPHGIVDPIILFSAKNSQRWLNLNKHFLWVVAYLTIAFCYATLWRAYPELSLWSFLILTTIHWGTSEYEPVNMSRSLWFLLGITRGGIIVVGVLALQTDGSYQVIQSISGDDAYLPNRGALMLSLILCSLVHFGTLVFVFRKDKSTCLTKVIDSGLILLLLALTPALLGMAIYYMFFHGERYYTFFKTEYKRLLCLTHIICLTIGCIVGLAYLYSPGLPIFNIKAIPSYFMLLAALTLPHSILVMRVQLNTKIHSTV